MHQYVTFIGEQIEYEFKVDVVGVRGATIYIETNPMLLGDYYDKITHIEELAYEIADHIQYNYQVHSVECEVNYEEIALTIIF